MGKFTTHSAQRAQKTALLFLVRKKLMLISLLLLLMSSYSSSAQSIFNMYWDSSVGCQDGENGVYRKTYLEFIEDGICLNVCNGSVVTYSVFDENYNPGSIMSTVWNITSGIGGQILGQTPTTCTVRWGTSGAGNIDAVVSTLTQTYDFPDLCVAIKQTPTALFTTGDSTNLEESHGDLFACVDETIYFNNLSVDNDGATIMYNIWDFYGNGTGGGFSSEMNPTFIYHTPGEYKITLTVFNGCSCSSSITRIIKVYDKRGFDISCPSVVCEGDRITYTLPEELRANCERYNWSVTNGTIVSRLPYTSQLIVDWTSDPHNPNTTGFGYVTFEPNDCHVGCTLPTTIKIPIILTHGTIEGDSDLCGTANKVYKLPQWPTTDFVWEVENDSQTQATIVYTDQRNEILVKPGAISGTIILKATYYNTLLNCGGTATKTIHIKGGTTIEGPIDAICPTSTQTYTNVDNLGGTWVLTKDPNTNIATYTGTVFNATFPESGDYTISLNGSNFCSKSTLKVKVNATPTLPLATDIIGNRVICPGEPLIYSIANNVPGTTIGWEVANGVIQGNAFGNQITVKWKVPSTTTSYSIKVWRQSSNLSTCRSADLIIPVNIENLILTITGDQTVCPNSTHTYTVPATNGEVYEWTISPATAGSITNANPTNHIDVQWNNFASPTTASLFLTVKKCKVLYHTPSNSIFTVVISGPQISILNPPTSLCRGENHTFEITSTPALTSNTGTIVWNFSDGTTANGTSVQHAFTQISQNSINYPVTVTVNSPNGCSNAATATNSVTVNVAPVASISPANTIVACFASDLNNTLTANIQSGFGATTSIVWYKNNVVINNIPPLTTSYIITDFGNYYAVVSNALCSTRTNTVFANQGGCIPPPACIIVPTPSLATVQTSRTCTSVAVEATATGGASAPSIHWTNGATTTTTTYNYVAPGNYSESFDAVYTVNGGPCLVKNVFNIIIPYQADLTYDVRCNATGTGYTVHLLDHSNYYADTPIDSWIFSVNNVVQPQSSTDLVNDRTLNLLPGNYTVRLSIAGSSYPACTKDIVLNLPALPNANFTFTNNVCQENAVIFTPTTPNDLSSTYLWSFDNGTPTLLLYNGIKTFTSGIHLATLTVTNSKGCAITSPLQNVQVNGNNLIGSLQANPGTVCAGNYIELKYNPTVLPLPSTYQWMHGTTPVAGATTNPYSTNIGGNYWLKIKDSHQCIKELYDVVSPTFVPAPTAQINGLHNVCLGVDSSFAASPLEGYSTVQYQWNIQGPSYNYSQTSGNNELLLQLPSVGDYTVALSVYASKNGIGCSAATSSTITVYEVPEITDLHLEAVSCNPFLANLFATSNTDGPPLTWSNGMSGSPITVTHGGPYEVTVVSGNGCSASKQITLPKDLESYMWIVPTGCYDFCRRFDDKALLGPSIVDFSYWSWNDTGVNVLDGVDSVEKLPITTSGSYGLQLKFGECHVERGTANITINACDCEVRVRLKDTIKLITEPFLQYRLFIHIDNSQATSIVVSINGLNEVGFFLPSAITVPQGGGDYEVIMIPVGTFTGGNVQITFHSIDQRGTMCESRYAFDFPENIIGSKTINPKGTPTSALSISPNPAQLEVSLQFEFASHEAHSQKSITIYDLSGRLLDNFNPVTATGQIKIDLSRYATGQYLVVMKENGVLLQQKRLVKE